MQEFSYPTKMAITTSIFKKERCQAKFLEGHLNELGLLIGPHKSAGGLVHSIVPPEISLDISLREMSSEISGGT